MRLTLFIAAVLFASPAAADTRAMFEVGKRLLKFTSTLSGGPAPEIVYGIDPDGCRGSNHCELTVGDAKLTATDGKLVFDGGTEMKPAARLMTCAGLTGEYSALGAKSGAPLGTLFNEAKAEGGRATGDIGTARVTAIVEDGLIGGCEIEVSGEN